MAPRCPCCGCDREAGERAHRLQAALGNGDLDLAMTLGLPGADIECTACSDDCRALLAAARDARLRALAARDRFRARALRLERRERERAARRTPVATPAAAGAGTTAPSLPPAAADALARAKAKVAGRKP